MAGVTIEMTGDESKAWAAIMRIARGNEELEKGLKKRRRRQQGRGEGSQGTGEGGHRRFREDADAAERHRWRCRS